MLTHTAVQRHSLLWENVHKIEKLGYETVCCALTKKIGREKSGRQILKMLNVYRAIELQMVLS